MNHQRLACSGLLLLALCEAACGWLWPRDRELEEQRSRVDASICDADLRTREVGAESSRDSSVVDQRTDPCGYYQDGGPQITWKRINAGTFMMGSSSITNEPVYDPCRYPDEEDAHQVTLTRNFEIQATEVTQEQFAWLRCYNPSQFKECGATCPVEMVNWHEAAAYCNALSKKAGLTPCYVCSGGNVDETCAVDSRYADTVSGRNIYACPGYRLPTEAEWEYAYRAGHSTPYYTGAIPAADKCGERDSKIAGFCPADSASDEIAWYCANSDQTTHPVGKKQANDFGLYDMAGNVWEWCHDQALSRLGTFSVSDPVSPPPAGSTDFTGVTRGGCFMWPAVALRAAVRDCGFHATDTAPDVGFRCVRTLP